MKRRLSLLSLALVGVVATAQAQSYSITDLGALPGNTSSFAFGMNDKGDVAGWSCNCTNNITNNVGTGFIWSQGVMKSIGWWPGGAPGSGLFAVNFFDQAVGVADPKNFQSNGILYRNNTLLEFDTSAPALFAHYISDTGVIVGDYTKGGGSSSGSYVPAFWTEDPSKPGRFRRTDLAPVPGDFVAYANAANQSLIIVGYTANVAQGSRGILWNTDRNHTPVVLAPAAGDQTAAAEGVNDLGVACGYSWFGTYRTNPVIWSADASHTPTTLPPLPGTSHAWAKAINNLGQVIGYGGDVSGVGGTGVATGATPVVWLNGQIYTLQSLLDASGAGWRIIDVMAINNTGQIAGNGVHNGVTSAFIMTPQ